MVKPIYSSFKVTIQEIISGGCAFKAEDSAGSNADAHWLFVYFISAFYVSHTFLVALGLLSGLCPGLSVALGLLSGAWRLTYLAM